MNQVRKTLALQDGNIINEVSHESGEEREESDVEEDNILRHVDEETPEKLDGGTGLVTQGIKISQRILHDLISLVVDQIVEANKDIPAANAGKDSDQRVNSEAQNLNKQFTLKNLKDRHNTENQTFRKKIFIKSR